LYLGLYTGRPPLSVELCCQQSEDIYGNIFVWIPPFPAAADAFHAQSEDEIYVSLAIFILFAQGLDTVFVTFRIATVNVFQCVQHNFSFEG